jgi:hypothetical protein
LSEKGRLTEQGVKNKYGRTREEYYLATEKRVRRSDVEDARVTGCVLQQTCKTRGPLCITSRKMGTGGDR